MIENVFRNDNCLNDHGPSVYFYRSIYKLSGVFARNGITRFALHACPFKGSVKKSSCISRVHARFVCTATVSYTSSLRPNRIYRRHEDKRRGRTDEHITDNGGGDILLLLLLLYRIDFRTTVVSRE